MQIKDIKEKKEKDKEEKEEEDQIDYDYVLENRIGFGKYQILNSIGIFLSVQLEGIEIVLISIIFPFINKEWNLKESEKILITQSIFVGILIGNLLGGYLGDKIGRKNAVNSGMMLSLIFAFISAQCYSFDWFLLTRTLTNVGVGMIIANANTMVAELYQKQYRLQSQVMLSIFWILGSITVSIISIIVITKQPSNDPYQNQWRALIIFSNVVALICLIAGLFTKESIKFLLDKQQFNQAFELINIAITQNNSDPQVLTEYEKEQLTLYYQQQTLSTQISDSYLEIFSPQFRRNVILMGIQWYANIQFYYFIIFILPILMNKNKTSKQENVQFEILVSNIPEYTVNFSMLFVLNNKYFKNEIFLKFFYWTAVILLTMSIFFENAQIYFLMILRGCASGSVLMSYLITSEIFPSNIKSRCYGFFSMMGRLGGIMMPVIVFHFMKAGIIYLILFQLLFVSIVLILENFIQYQQQSQSTIDSKQYSKFENIN